MGIKEDFSLMWAKKRDSGHGYMWMPLPVHLTDTMNVAGWLWNGWLSESQRRCIMGGVYIDGDPAGELITERLIRFLASMHDIGKATPAFQTKKGFIDSPDLDSVLMERLELAGFTGISSLELASRKASPHNLAGEYILTSLGVDKDIASIVGGHHGIPIDSNEVCEEQASYEANYYQSESRNSRIYNKWKDLHKYILDWALDECEIGSVDNLPQISQAVQALLSGMIIMADWIASNDRYFPLIDVEQVDVTDKESRFKEGMSKWWRNSPLRQDVNDDAGKIYEDRFGFPPREFQSSIFNIVKEINDPGMIIIEAPTGCGKTETALITSEQLAARTGASGIFFGLPTQATSNGIFPRVREWLDSLAGQYGDASIQLVHGKAALTSYKEGLPNDPAGQVDLDNANGTVFINEWFCGRKTSALDDFVVGTVDNFLLTSLKQRHLALRHLGMSKKVVIIDEVHAYDAYMQEYLAEALRWMGAYRVPVVLLSATLPVDIRNELLRSYQLGRGGINSKIKENIRELSNVGYPAITYTDGMKIEQKIDFAHFARKKIGIRNLDEENLYTVIGDAMDRGAVVGVIVNTVKRSQEIFARCAHLFGADNVELMHANFIATDRIAKEDKLKKMIGKGADRPDKKVIIGTQVLEQSLDIDFDLLITDLCPIDLLIQRIGRLHRHAIKRPQGFEDPLTFVLGENEDLEFEKGSSLIYSDYLLARTQYYLPEILTVPAAVSQLVQDVYGQEEPDYKSELAGRYRAAKEKFDLKRTDKKSKAGDFRIDKPKRKIDPAKNNMIGWLARSFSDNDEQTSFAQVRDIEPSIEVIALKECQDGYQTFSGSGELSSRIDDTAIQKMIAGQTLSLPRAAVPPYNVSKAIKELEDYNRDKLPSWQETSWLKGQLGVIFDEEGVFIINGKTLRYDSELGLRVLGKDEDE